jgi:DNA-binding CsgD family transcriptional regulator
MVAMNSFRDLSHTDLQLVMLICEQLHQADSSESFVKHCQSVMQNGFSNVHFSAERYQLKPFALLEQPIQSLGDEYLPLFREHLMEHPYLARMLTEASSEISMTHIEPTARKFRKSSLYNEFYNEVQAQNQLWVGIHEGNELLNCVYSRESEYTENELAMMCIIQPHLETAWKNWKRTRALQQELGVLKQAIFQSEEEEAKAAVTRKVIDNLTRRQRDVVELVADGMDNQQIGDYLKISIGTVKKHLQLAFQALEVQHRTELAAKWHQAHSITLY